jgi:Tfp pilus assembly protein PilV
VKRTTGFTLIETLVTTLILVTGLVAIVGAISYGIITNIRVRQQTTALTLLTDKMEELKGQPALTAGRYVDHVQSGYQRTWEISSESPQRVTVIVFGLQPGSGASYRELARASTLVGRGF